VGQCHCPHRLSLASDQIDDSAGGLAVAVREDARVEAHIGP
jgi:hypothetical protein